MRGVRRLAVPVSGLMLFMLFVPSGAGGEPPVVRPAAGLPYDLGPWFVGDAWSYEIHVVAADPSGLTIDSVSLLNETVAGVETVTVLGRTYTAYNSTVTGRLDAQGTFPPATFSVSDPSISGWALTDRSNLARIAENETVHAQGFVQYLFFTWALWMNTSTTTFHGPAEEDYDFPLELSDAWAFQGTANTTGYREVYTTAPGWNGSRQPIANESVVDVRSWFNATQPMNVPAGMFLDAAWIHTESGGASVDRWYHPDVRNFVQMQSHTVNAPDDYVDVWANLTAFSLADPPPWLGTINLVPSRVNPGGWVTAIGTANADEDLFVRVPAIGASYSTRSNSTGDWSLRIAAPTADDFTPTNGDVGSHGAIVEPAIAPAGSAVATLQLLVPDLYVGPGDLSLSDPFPVAGTPVDVQWTVRSGAAVGAHSPFNVSVTIDGSLKAQFGFLELAAGEAQSGVASWTPVPGSHTIAVMVDSGEEIPEMDEGNNTAQLTVFVSGPDLAPMDVIVEAEFTDTYADPAAVGYVSARAQGRIGGLVNVSFYAANVGSADADWFYVEVVETAGLFGPPAGAPILRVGEPARLAPGERSGPYVASWPVPSGPGVYHLNLTVDADDLVAEESEANNTFAVVVNVSGPDYRIEDVLVPALATTGSAHDLEVRVRNDGQLPGGLDVVVAGYEGGSGTPFTTAIVSPLAVSETQTVTLPWFAPGTVGIVSLSFVVDPDGRLDEMDEANNGASATVDVRAPPATAISWSGPNVTTTKLFVSSEARFSLTAEDRSGTGYATLYMIDATSPVPYTGPFGLAEGDHVIWYWSEDNLGGSEVPQALAVGVDDSPPQTSATAAPSVGPRREVTLTATDRTGVGVDSVEYRVAGGPWIPYSGSFNVTGTGHHNVTYRSTDLLGHREADQFLEFTISPESSSPSVNWKPLLAVAFAAILLALGYMFGRGAGGGSLGSPRTLGIVFAAAELATGGLSLVTPALAVPSSALGLAVDLVILVAGTLAVAFVRTPRNPSAAEAGEQTSSPGPEAGTPK